MARTLPRSLLARLRRVKLFLCDVDGILTDDGLYMDGTRELKRFDIRDGLGLRLLQASGIEVGWISGRSSPATAQRARDLKVDYLRQGPQSKVAVIEALLRKAGLGWAAVCYMGDDLLDLGALKRAGVAISVPEGLAEARALADHVTEAQGGHGAVREAVELILRAQGRWRPLLAQYSR